MRFWLWVSGIGLIFAALVAVLYCYSYAFFAWLPLVVGALAISAAMRLRRALREASDTAFASYLHRLRLLHMFIGITSLVIIFLILITAVTAFYSTAFVGS